MSLPVGVPVSAHVHTYASPGSKCQLGRSSGRKRTAIQRLTGGIPISVGHNPYAIAVTPDSMTVANDLRHRHAHPDSADQAPLINDGAFAGPTTRS